jgi:hypothetical protein
LTRIRFLWAKNNYSKSRRLGGEVRRFSHLT